MTDIGWQPPDENSRIGALWVRFTDGTTGFYSNVERDIFEQLRDSPSKGRFLHDFVIKMGYPFTVAQPAAGQLS